MLEHEEVPGLECLHVGSYYDGPVKELILRLKFHRLRSRGTAWRWRGIKP